MSVAFGPGDRWLATAGDDRTVRLWDCASGDPLELAVAHDEDLLGVRFVAGGRRLLAYGPRTVLLVPVEALARQPDARALAAEVRRRTGHVLNDQDEVEPGREKR